ncbi:unnamed protein product [Camellia sinensis]
MQLVRGNGQGVHCTCKEEKDGEVPWVLHLYTAERLSSFGELALMNNKPLQASVRAVTSGTLWLLRSVDLLSRLTILQLSHIAESLSEVSFSEGQIIADRDEQIKALLQSVGTSFCPDYLDWFGNGATDSHSRNADQFEMIRTNQDCGLYIEDAEGLIVLNIGSYMGGVDLWQNDYEHDDDFNLLGFGNVSFNRLNMATLRNLKIKTSTCKRIVKEMHSYEKEVEREAAKTADMKEKGADPYDLKQQLLLAAYSTISIQDASLFLGMNEDDATNCM